MNNSSIEERLEEILLSLTSNINQEKLNSLMLELREIVMKLLLSKKFHEELYASYEMDLTVIHKYILGKITQTPSGYTDRQFVCSFGLIQNLPKS